MDFVNHTDTLTHKGSAIETCCMGQKSVNSSIGQYWVLGHSESVKCCFLMMSLNENHKALTDLMKDVTERGRERERKRKGLLSL